MYPVLTPAEVEWAYKKWCEGYTQQQLADVLHVHTDTLRRYFNGRPRVRPALIIPPEVLKAREEERARW